MPKSLEFGTVARRSIKRGVKVIYDAVSQTLGPKGRNVILEKPYGAPVITNDGVSIAREIELFDRFENLGASLIKQVADKTNNVAGDGTTTSTVITYALVDEGLKFVESGLNPVGIRNGMDQALKEALIQLKKQGKKINTKKEITQVATISAESKEHGELLAEIVEKIGKDGVITLETLNDTKGMKYELVKGLDFDKGFLSPYFMNNEERQECILEKTLVLITDRKISAAQEITPLLEKIHKSGQKNLLIVADDVEAEALALLVVNKMKGILNLVAVKAPEVGKENLLEDLATLTQTEVFTSSKGIKLEDLELDQLGKAKKIIVSKDKTTIVDGEGDVEGRISSLKYELEKEKDNGKKEDLRKRIAKLGSGVAILRVGASTETELTYLKHKMEDAVNATKAAIEEGIVCGGGVALAKIYLSGKDKDKDFQAGYDTVRKALKSPLLQIVKNGGLRSPEVVLNEILEMGGNAGYDAKNDTFVHDMLETGIIDPLKVVRSALENAVSVSGVLLTTCASVTERPAKPIKLEDPEE